MGELPRRLQACVHHVEHPSLALFHTLPNVRLLCPACLPTSQEPRGLTAPVPGDLAELVLGSGGSAGDQGGGSGSSMVSQGGGSERSS